MWPARLVHASKRALAGSFSLDEGQVVEEYFEPRHPAALTARAPWHSVAGLGTHTVEHKKSPIHTSPMGAYLMCPDDGRFHVEGWLAEARCRESKTPSLGCRCATGRETTRRRRTGCQRSSGTRVVPNCPLSEGG
jgi:hypothetical protein